jgi:2-aminoethylphosphonate-pyruvate transaminase
VAFHQALLELEAEGGVAGRANRYRENFQVLVDGMRKMGFRTYLAPERMGYIISTFCYPDDPRFDFEEFYRLLNEQGFVIYPGKVGKANCFRIGNIGRLFPTEMRLLLSAIERVLEAMQIPLKY